MLEKYYNNLRKSEIQWTLAIKFVSSKYTDKESEMHTKNENVEIMISD